MPTRICLPVALFASALGLSGPAFSDAAQTAPRIYYGPAPATAQLDVAALAGAKKTIDLAAFVLTDRDVIAALNAAGRRNVTVRVYLDRDEMERSSARVDQDLAGLAAIKGVTIRYKARRSEAMHLKSYAIDGRVLRTGSANFSKSGERYQDNDIVFVQSAPLVMAFTRNFEAMWARPDNEDFAR